MGRPSRLAIEDGVAAWASRGRAVTAAVTVAVTVARKPVGTDPTDPG
ncbi:MAG: hypothetical protein WCF16_01535 [Alphaproteobacteria bacterium]